MYMHVHVLPLRASADIDEQLEAAALRRNLSVTNVKSILHVRVSRSAFYMLLPSLLLHLSLTRR